MSYEKTTWATGDVVTAEKLNKLEDGIENISQSEDASPVFIVRVQVSGSSPSYEIEADKSFDEINAAYIAGKIPFVHLTVVATGAPESYWERMVLPMRECVTDNTFEFCMPTRSNGWFSVTVDFNNSWYYSNVQS